ncbi:MAG TPA: class I SAM-dependent methyltransferase [Polyangia bacterium]|nr:class I SAM-dependent methyltransferase [Polyangia bacterium]
MTTGDTRDVSYAERLEGFDRGWRRLLDVQRPYRWHIRRLDLGFVLDLGCGVGRNLSHLNGNGVGVDHSAATVERARARGLQAFTPEEFHSSNFAQSHRFDALLVAHVVEHMTFSEAAALVTEYLPLVRPGGRVVFIVPQRAGFRSDPTHVEFFDESALRRLAHTVGLEVSRCYSFPFIAWAGGLFPYNETVLIATVHDAGGHR